MLGSLGVEKVIEIKLTNEERDAFFNSVDRIRSGVEEIKQISGLR